MKTKYRFQDYYFACPTCFFPRGFSAKVNCPCGAPVPEDKHPMTDEEMNKWKERINEYK